MHNLKEIRKDFDNFKKSLEKRSIEIDISNLEKLDKKNRELIQKKESLEQEKKEISKSKDKSLFEKSKKLSQEIDNITEEIKNHETVLISIKKEKNLDKLINLIKENLKNKFILQDDIYITRQRHRTNLEKCVEHLTNFEEKNSLEDFDKAAEDLRLATRYLGTIVGKVDVEEILGSIFNDFCIGK